MNKIKSVKKKSKIVSWPVCKKKKKIKKNKKLKKKKKNIQSTKINK